MLFRSVWPEADGHAVARRQIPEESQPLVTTAHDVHNGRKPVLILRLDPELAFPLGIEQVGIGPGQLVPREQLRVVRLHPHRKQRRRPLLVRRHGTGLEVGVHRHDRSAAGSALEQRFHLGRAEMDDVDVVPPAAASAIVRCSTRSVPARQTVTLIPYFDSKGWMRSGQVLFGDRGVERQRAFMLRCRRVGCIAGAARLRTEWRRSAMTQRRMACAQKP